MDCGLCILRQMNALTHKLTQSKERLMKIYIKIYFSTLKFIVLWTYAKEAVGTSYSELLCSMNNKVEGTWGPILDGLSGVVIMDLMAQSWSSISSTFVRGHNEKMRLLEKL